MYYYKFESIDFEEQYAFELTHWKKFTSKELDEMVIKAIKAYIEEDYDSYLNFPCHLDIGDLFFDEILQDTLVKLLDLIKSILKVVLNMVANHCSVMIFAIGIEKILKKS